MVHVGSIQFVHPEIPICWDGIQGSIQKGCDEAPLHTESSGWGQIFLETWTEGCCSVNMKIGENHWLVGGLEHFLCSHILGIIPPTDCHIFQRG